MKADAAEPVSAACSCVQPHSVDSPLGLDQEPLACGALRRPIQLIAMAALMAVWFGVMPARSEPQRPPVPVRCRLAGGPWQDCQMLIERIGERWCLVVGAERVWFEHDGRGRVRMLRGSGGWIPVDARWTADAALCWDGICAKGELPLD